MQLGVQLPVRPRAAEGVPGRRLEPWRRRMRHRSSHGEAGQGGGFQKQGGEVGGGGGLPEWMVGVLAVKEE